MPKKRPDEDIPPIDKLEWWKITKSDKPFLIRAICPHCDKSVMVHKASWAKSIRLPTRPCTYCFKTSRIY